MFYLLFCPLIIEALRKYGNSTYLRILQEKSWFDARDFCLSQDSHLVDLDDMQENEFVLRLPEKNAGEFWLKKFWIGLNDLQAEGVFVNSRGDRPSFLNWNNDEPNDAGNGEDCTEVRLYGNWNDISCSYLKPFVCEKSKGEFI